LPPQCPNARHWHHHWRAQSTPHYPKLDECQATEPDESTDGGRVAAGEGEEMKRCALRQFELTRRTFRGGGGGSMNENT
jgi:hypothetical protein